MFTVKTSNSAVNTLNVYLVIVLESGMASKVKLDNDSGKYVYLYLFKNIKNASELKELVTSGKLSCSIIKPSLIIDPLQVVVAANKAVVSEMQSTMTTKTLSTEMLYSLSNSKNISQSLMKFGISDRDEVMLVAIIGKDCENIDALEHFKGNNIPLDELKHFSDVTLIKNTYKVKDIELSVSSLTDLIVTRIVTRDFA